MNLGAALLIIFATGAVAGGGGMLALHYARTFAGQLLALAVTAIWLVGWVAFVAFQMPRS